MHDVIEWAVWFLALRHGGALPDESRNPLAGI